MTLLILRWIFSENALSHWSHLKSSSPVCIFLCVLRWPTHVNDLLNSSHLNSFTPAWFLWWLRRLTFRVNALLHWPHLNSFSPICVFQCTFRWPSCMNFLTLVTFKIQCFDVNFDVTESSLKWLLTKVPQRKLWCYTSKKLTSAHFFFVKIGTFMFLFTSMNRYMHFKATLLCESFVTLVTFKFLLTGTNLIMINKGISCTDHI